MSQRRKNTICSNTTADIEKIFPLKWLVCVSSNLNPPAAFSVCSGNLSNKTTGKQQIQQQQELLSQSLSVNHHTQRQENFRLPSELSFIDSSCQWQEQVSQLQRQLDFSTSMCQTLLQDQQVSAFAKS